MLAHDQFPTPKHMAALGTFAPDIQSARAVRLLVENNYAP